MRIYPTKPTEEEIATHKRLRQICDWFKDLNARVAASHPVQGLTPKVVQEIAAQNFQRADLMAIRNAPHKWTRADPYKWLWLLHRYQNQCATLKPSVSR